MRRCLLRKDSYHDSVKLMQVSAALKGDPGVRDVVVAMGTPHNLQRLAELGWTEGFTGAGPNDLLVAIDAADAQTTEDVQARLDELLKPARSAAAEAGLAKASGWAGALEALPEANLALISLPGRYAALEARKALRRGLHVLLFSDNVSLEDEVELKKLSTERGLLLMGPGCGTAVLDGVPLCFANELRRGAIGIVGAAGTGIQEVAACIDRAGEGVSQAIGTGGRDLRAEVGGRTFLQGIAALAADTGTKVIVAISKPPAEEVAARVEHALESCGKPAVVHFVGVAPRAPSEREHVAGTLEDAALAAVARIRGRTRVYVAATLEDAALAAVALVRRRKFVPAEFVLADKDVAKLVARERAGKSKAQRFVRGYFTGGTVCDEALYILSRTISPVRSNIHPDPALQLADPFRSEGHAVVDLGDDVFTVGRPHPMIDPTVRTDRMEAEADDRGIAVVLLDVVIGHGSHADPAGALVPALRTMQLAAKRARGALTVIASVVGTDRDFQNRATQVATLEAEGVIVMPSNAQAARLAVRIAGSGKAAQNHRGAELGDKGVLGGRKVAQRSSGEGESRKGGLLKGPLQVVNLGLESFAQTLRARDVPVVQVDWRPPAGGDVELARALDALVEKRGKEIHDANQKVVEILLSAKPRIVGIGRALDVVPGMRRELILHAGPPITWERMCGPLRGGVIGGLLYEGLAKDRAEAEALAASGKIAFEPCHHHRAVGPMAGIVTASMPVWIVENERHGNRAFATLNEGLGKVLRYGAFAEEVLERLRWMRDVLAPLLSRAIERRGPVELKPLIAQALQMGDELHNRNRAGTSLLFRELAPHLVRTGALAEDQAQVLKFIHGNDHFFLNLSMAAAKATVDPAYGVRHSTIVVTMARNGTDFGVRVSGLGERWFVAPSPRVEGLYLPGYGPDDAALDIGDSVITETVGLGGCAMAAAPAIVRFVGGSPEDALATTRRMYEITAAENDAYQIPALDFRGTPTGIDLLKIVETGIVPAVNTGIAHKEPGIGMVGAGMVKPPLECFLDAARALVELDRRT